MFASAQNGRRLKKERRPFYDGNLGPDCKSLLCATKGSFNFWFSSFRDTSDQFGLCGRIVRLQVATGIDSLSANDEWIRLADLLLHTRERNCKRLLVMWCREVRQRFRTVWYHARSSFIAQKAVRNVCSLHIGSKNRANMSDG
ncbi:hypothetical protein URH17368_0527 [Alicyclobacillus hesperidum URH17-3-68]|nr:hypothetical protein URH17368_0527 [Alicyclobacillus hesperidum URH17-3-68]